MSSQLERVKSNLRREIKARQDKELEVSKQYSDRYRRGFVDALTWACQIIDHEITIMEGDNVETSGD